MTEPTEPKEKNVALTSTDKMGFKVRAHGDCPEGGPTGEPKISLGDLWAKCLTGKHFVVWYKEWVFNGHWVIKGFER